MIQLNLLPDVKLLYIKTQRQRRLILSVSIIVSISAIAILLILLGVEGIQKKNISDLNRDIKNKSATLKTKPKINQILTVQNQLESLTSLHSAKPAVARVFDYIYEVTPASVDLNKLTVDANALTLNISGTTDSLSSVNSYIDILKSTTYNSTEIPTNDSASTNSSSSPTNTGTHSFSNIVLSSFGLNSGGDKSKSADFSINMVYDKNIFDINQQINLVVPSETITRASLQQPTDLFKAAPTTSTSNTKTGN
ncbi:MAG TPA: PilN domain-containing protein [Candidatus Saccharimonadales bacterium]|nr:PilN domain-containing protein [Candidatus Saccharimonadales bacterium]